MLESLRLLRSLPDVFHLNDYQTGLVPILLREAYKTRAALPAHRNPLLDPQHGLPGDLPARPRSTCWAWRDALAYPTGPLEFYGKVNFMKAAILYADLISTVSERYAAGDPEQRGVRLRAGRGAARARERTSSGS